MAPVPDLLLLECGCNVCYKEGGVACRTSVDSAAADQSMRPLSVLAMTLSLVLQQGLEGLQWRTGTQRGDSRCSAGQQCSMCSGPQVLTMHHCRSVSTQNQANNCCVASKSQRRDKLT